MNKRACGECWYFIRDSVNPRDGVGRCRIAAPAFARGLPYPGVRRECAAFEELNEDP